MAWHRRESRYAANILAMIALAAVSPAGAASTTLNATAEFGGIAIPGTTTVTIAVNPPDNANATRPCFQGNLSWTQPTLALLSSVEGISTRFVGETRVGLVSVSINAELEQRGWPVGSATPESPQRRSAVLFSPWPSSLVVLESQVSINNSCTVPVVQASFQPIGGRSSVRMVATQPRTGTNRSYHKLPAVSSRMLNSTSGAIPLSAVFPDDQVVRLSQQPKSSLVTIRGMTQADLHAEGVAVKWMSSDPRKLEAAHDSSVTFSVVRASVCGVVVSEHTMMATFLPQAPCHILPHGLFDGMMNQAANQSQAVLTLQSGDEVISLPIPTVATGLAGARDPMVDLKSFDTEAPKAQCFERQILHSLDSSEVIGISAAILQSSELVLDRESMQFGIIQQPIRGCRRAVNQPRDCEGLWNLATQKCVSPDRCNWFLSCSVFGFMYCFAIFFLVPIAIGRYAFVHWV